MPMDIEFCASCGCTEFSHTFVEHECEPTCDEDCEFAGESVAVCECGDCGDYTWIENPQGTLCRCGCPEDEHASLDQRRDHGDDGADVAADQSACEQCGDCGGFMEWATELEVLREQLEQRGESWPRAATAAVVAASTIRLAWLDEPLEIVGALVADAEGQPTRRVGLPAPDEAVFLGRADRCTATVRLWILPRWMRPLRPSSWRVVTARLVNCSTPRSTRSNASTRS